VTPLMQEPSKDTIKLKAPLAKPAACQQGCRFFQGKLSAVDAGRLGPLIKVGKKQTIYEKGQPAHFCYKVVEGSVRVSRVLMDGHRQILSIHLPNEAFGIEYSDAYSATAEAVSDVTLLRCPRACIAKISESESDARHQMMCMLSREALSAQEHLVMLGHQGAKVRVASFFLRLAELAGGKNGATIDMPVGRQDMADYLGLTIETTCRAITDFKESGIIAVPNRYQVVVRNFAGLKAIADAAD
jgi:CRP/FNR family nitrogen fixation transcriptional regulator